MPTPSPVDRPLKRRLSSTDLDFFTPAAVSFRPRPYSPRALSANLPLPAPHRHLSRPLDTHTHPPVGMDPQPADPNVLFIRPPFNSFPRAELYPDGLSYQLMADNPEWFLDADDFISQNNSNQNAIPYPPNLEPPRGWCPAKKKDLKDRGPDGWPIGEEPRLRCTFCRRTYAGVNAKSMWRRHVFEKHKIAMSNRRDGSDRPRGRGSNKENRSTIKSQQPPHPHDKLVSIDVDPQLDFCGRLHNSRFRSLVSVAEAARQRPKPLTNEADHPPASSSSTVSQPDVPSPKADPKPRLHPLSRSHVPPPSPPLTPQSSIPSDPANHPPDAISQLSASPPALPVVPPSPYDPLLTPSFRHSPPRLPSDQPWRFPSPSHPLHSRSREISLSMLVRDFNSPAAKNSLAAGESPRIVASPATSPRIFLSTTKQGVLDLGTPESLEKLSRSSPRAFFHRGRFPLSGHKTRYLIQESPLQHTAKTIIKSHRPQASSFSDEWLADVSVSSATTNIDSLTSSDPFTIVYSPWRRTVGSQERPSSPTAVAGAESPVLRNTALPSGVGLGIGLLAPFIPEGTAASARPFDEMLTHKTLAEEADDEAEVACFLETPTKDLNAQPNTPPSKKRRITPPEPK